MDKVLPIWCKNFYDKEINIDNIKIGPYERPAIIAEIGINHNGSIDDAKKLADLAAENGADIIKTQIHIASSEIAMKRKQ